MAWVIEPRTAAEHTLNKLDPQIAGLFLTFLCELASKLENPTVIGKALSGVGQTLLEDSRWRLSVN